MSASAEVCPQCSQPKPVRWFRARNGSRWQRCEECRIRGQIRARELDIERLKRRLARVEAIRDVEMQKHQAARERADAIAP